VAVDEIVFWVFAPISIGSAIAMLLQRNAVHAALFLVVNFFTIAVFYLVLGASFLFAVQIIVYAGAIMVLFLFVIMLLGVDREETLVERLRGSGCWRRARGGDRDRARRGDPCRDRVRDEGPGELRRDRQPGWQRAGARRVLFRQYFFPFEVTSVLLIVAAIAVVVFASRQRRAITRAEAATAGHREAA
jgi:NADH-quinone oxidoreductase subunit J